ncbi:MAG: ABC transporter substrate-binding protein [Bacillota bacterium]
MLRTNLHRVLALGLSILIITALAGCGGGQATQPTDTGEKPAEAETFKVGLGASFTGDYAVYGHYHYNAAKLAADEINAAGGVLGRKIELVKGDDKADPKEAASVAQKFVADKDVVAVLGHIFSSTSLAAGPIYQQGGLSSIVVLASNPKVPLVGDYIFRINVHDGIAGSQTAEYVVKSMGKKRIGILVDNTDYCIGFKDAFVAKAEELGGSITDVEFYMGQQDKDFSVVLRKLQEKNPEVVLLSSYHTEGALITQQVRQMGWDVQLVAPDACATPDYLELAGAAAEGAVLTTYFHRDVPDPKAQALVKTYEETFNEETFVSVPYTYDAMYVLIAAIERAGSFDRAAIRDEIAKTKDFPGVTGSITFDEDGDRPVGWNIVLDVKNGEFVIRDMIMGTE